MRCNAPFAQRLRLPVFSTTAYSAPAGQGHQNSRRISLPLALTLWHLVRCEGHGGGNEGEEGDDLEGLHGDCYYLMLCGRKVKGVLLVFVVGRQGKVEGTAYVGDVWSVRFQSFPSARSIFCNFRVLSLRFKISDW